MTNDDRPAGARTGSPYPYLGWTLRWQPGQRWPRGAPNQTMPRRRLLPRAPGDARLRLGWHPLSEMWWGQRGRAIAVVVPPSWDLNWTPVVVGTGAMVAMASVVILSAEPSFFGGIAAASRNGGLGLVGCFLLLFCMAAARLAVTRVVEATPGYVRVTLQLGPLALRRQIPLHAAGLAALRETHVGKGRRTRLSLRYFAELRVTNALAMTLFPTVLPAQREPLERVVDAINGLVRARRAAGESTEPPREKRLER